MKGIKISGVGDGGKDFCGIVGFDLDAVEIVRLRRQGFDFKKAKLEGPELQASLERLGIGRRSESPP